MPFSSVNGTNLVSFMWFSSFVWCVLAFACLPAGFVWKLTVSIHSVQTAEFGLAEEARESDGPGAGRCWLVSFCPTASYQVLARLYPAGDRPAVFDSVEAVNNCTVEARLSGRSRGVKEFTTGQPARGSSRHPDAGRG